MAKSTVNYRLFQLFKASENHTVTKQKIIDEFKIAENSVAVYIFSFKKAYKDAVIESITAGNRKITAYKLATPELKVEQFRKGSYQDKPKEKRTLKTRMAELSSNGAIPIIEDTEQTQISDRDIAEIRSSLAIDDILSQDKF